VVSFNDSDNLTIENVLYELESHGHEITIFAPFRDENSIRMFQNLKAEIRPTIELTNDVAKKFDVAFCSVMMMKARLKFLDIYCFVYAPYFEECFMTDGADFLFTYRKLLMPRHDFRCASMPVGDPKNDKMIYQKTAETKRILFIDSGHMPFGTTGKKQIANMILDICKKFPDYELCIKPRWLRGSNINYTHINTEHIYSVIESCCQGDIPSNLNMLNEHLNLQDLIDSSICVITLYTSAILNVILQGKGLLIASGWENEDKWDVRNAIDIKDKYELFCESGCVVDYREITKYLPEGLHANEDFSNKIFTYRTGASQRIVDVMEYVYKNYLQHGIYPEAKKYLYETYQEEMRPDPSITLTTLKQERIRDILQQKVALFSYKITAPVDFSAYYMQLEETYRKCPFTENGFQKYFKSFDTLQKQILIDNATLLENDAINQSFLLEALYLLGKKVEILEIPPERILCKGPYHYYLGVIYREAKLHNLAIQNFMEFLKEANSRSYNKYPQEGKKEIRTVWNYLFQIFNGNNIPAGDFVNLYSTLHARGEKLTVHFNHRKRAHRCLPALAESLMDSDPEIALQCLFLYAQHDRAYNLDPLNRKIKKLEQENFKLKNSLSQRAKKIALWLPHKIRGGIRCLRENGWNYTRVHEREKIKEFYVKKVKALLFSRGPLCVWLHFRNDTLKAFQTYKSLIKKHGENVQFYKTAAGTGDTYIASMYFQAYLANCSCSRKPVFTVVNESCKQVAQLFQISNIEIIPHKKRQALTRMAIFAGFDHIHLTILHHNPKSLYTSILAAMETIHDMSNLDVLKGTIYNNIPDTAKLHYESDEEYISSVFNEFQLVPNKTVLIAPYTASMVPIPPLFWEMLVHKLQKQGYTVVINFNSRNSRREAPIPGAQAISIPIQQLVPFVEKCGYLIGARSGLFDITESAKVKRIIIYGNIQNGGRGAGGHNHEMLDHFPFNKWFNNDDAAEIIYKPEAVQEIMSAIEDYMRND